MKYLKIIASILTILPFVLLFMIYSIPNKYLSTKKECTVIVLSDCSYDFIETSIIIDNVVNTKNIPTQYPCDEFIQDLVDTEYCYVQNSTIYFESDMSLSQTYTLIACISLIIAFLIWFGIIIFNFRDSLHKINTNDSEQTYTEPPPRYSEVVNEPPPRYSQVI